MVGIKRVLLWQFLAIALVLPAFDRVMAEEVGTTSEGNVIYRFRCPFSVTINVHLKWNWPNHISDHPEFDITGGGSTQTNRQVSARKTHSGVRRSGQVLTCEYRVAQGEGYGFTGPLAYRYEVRRDIISCKHIDQMTTECILKP